jgi:UDP-N-acetylmuramate--alanine ligase
LIYKWNLKKYFTTFESSYSYHLSDEKADFYATDMQLRKHQFHFSLQHPNGIIRDLSIPMPGRINLENAVAASAAAILAGVQEKYIREGLQSFAGIKRRMELILQNNKISYYDDYAHHPEEIKASILSIKELYPFEELTVVFQPHLFSRTQDFAPAFAQSLQLADKIILMEIYLAREKPIPGVSSQMIIDLMERNKGQIVQKDQLINHLQNNKPKLLLSLGAGDIDRFVEPIKKAFL